MCDKNPDVTIRVGGEDMSIDVIRQCILECNIKHVDAELDALCREARRAVSLEAGITEIVASTWNGPKMRERLRKLLEAPDETR